MDKIVCLELNQLRAKVEECVRCGLCRGRSRIVFGEGKENAEVMFVGEAPGYYEDIVGRPFVGKAGNLLTKMINSMNLKREDVYVCNIIKCRPLCNRKPTPLEMESCLPFLKQQIDYIRPKVIVLLGASAYQGLFDSLEKISVVEGVWKRYCGIAVMPTFHPAYVLRNPQCKRYVWRDLKLVMEKLHSGLF